MLEKRTDKNSTLPRKKAHKNCAKHLTRTGVSGKIFAATQPRSHGLIMSE